MSIRPDDVNSALTMLRRSCSATEFGRAVAKVIGYVDALEKMYDSRLRAMNEVTTERDELRLLLSPQHECVPPERDPREPTGNPARLKWTCQCGRRWIYLRRIVARQLQGEWKPLADPLEDMRDVSIIDSVHATLEQPDTPVQPEKMGELAARHPGNSQLKLTEFGTHKWYIRTDEGLKPMVPGAFGALAVYPIDIPPGRYVLEDGTRFIVIEGRGTSYPTRADWRRAHDDVVRQNTYPAPHPAVNFLTQSMTGRFVTGPLPLGDGIPEHGHDAGPYRDPATGRAMDAALHEQLQEDAARDAERENEG